MTRACAAAWRGRAARGSARETGNRAWPRSNGGDLDRARLRSRCNGCADESTLSQSTLSAEETLTTVQVFYRFHPLHGYKLRVVQRTRRGGSAVTVVEPSGARLKIPTWMVSPVAAQMLVSERAHLSAKALLNLAKLLESVSTQESRTSDRLPTNVSGRKKGGRRGTTSTLRSHEK